MLDAPGAPPPAWVTRSIFCPSIWPSWDRKPDSSDSNSAVDRSLSASTASSDACSLSVSRLLNSSYFSANASSGSAHIFSLTSASSRINPVTWSMPSFYQITLKVSRAALRSAR